MKTVPYKKAKRILRNLIHQVMMATNPTLITTKEGQDVVILPLAVYNGWITTNHLMSTMNNRNRLLAAMADVKAGKVVSRDIIEE